LNSAWISQRRNISSSLTPLSYRIRNGGEAHAFSPWRRSIPAFSKKKGHIMKQMMIGAVAAATLLAGVSAANAQYYHDGGYRYGGPMVERSVGLQVGRVGVYDDGPVYYEGTPAWKSRAFRGDNTHSPYNTRTFRWQERMPQSPPGGGGN
jgi:hypothetical protein